jgi:uncharacterized membrane protein
MTVAWSIYGFLNVVEMNLSMMMQSAYRFKELAFNTIIAGTVSSLMLFGLVLDVAPIYAVIAVTVGQAIVLVLVVFQVYRLLSSRGHAEPSPTEAENARQA